jgi:hypothetical protein
MGKSLEEQLEAKDTSCKALRNKDCKSEHAFHCAITGRECVARVKADHSVGNDYVDPEDKYWIDSEKYLSCPAYGSSTSTMKRLIGHRSTFLKNNL